jgi:hypothetical protein
MLKPNEIDLKGEVSDVLFVTGLLCKGRSEDDVDNFLSNGQSKYIETDAEVSAPGGGKLWVRYESIAAAKKAQALLHQQSFKGCTIMARFELGFDSITGKHIVARNSVHTTCIRRIQQRRGENNNNGKQIIEKSLPANYSYKSLSIGETEFPFPSGLYLARLISLVQKCPNRSNDPLVELLSNNYVTSNNKSKNKRQSIFGNRYAKEITESMAMVDAVERAMKLCLGRRPSSFENSNNHGCRVRIYCVGDGKYPVTAAAMALHYPYPGWEFISIDPLSVPMDIKGTQHQLIQYTGKSEDYVIPPPPPLVEETDEVQYLDLVVACHSHAPLQEFWDRILKRNRQFCDGRRRAIAITMACCAGYSYIDQEPVLIFDDFEVYSPKREIRIYNDYVCCAPIID